MPDFIVKAFREKCRDYPKYPKNANKVQKLSNKNVKTYINVAEI